MKSKKKRYQKGVEFVQKNALEEPIDMELVVDAMVGHHASRKKREGARKGIYYVRDCLWYNFGQKLIFLNLNGGHRDITHLKIQTGRKSDKKMAKEHDEKKVNRAISYANSANKDLNRSLESWGDDAGFLGLKAKSPIIPPSLPRSEKKLITD